MDLLQVFIAAINLTFLRIRFNISSPLFIHGEVEPNPWAITGDNYSFEDIFPPPHAPDFTASTGVYENFSGAPGASSLYQWAGSSPFFYMILSILLSFALVLARPHISPLLRMVRWATTRSFKVFGQTVRQFGSQASRTKSSPSKRHTIGSQALFLPTGQHCVQAQNMHDHSHLDMYAVPGMGQHDHYGEIRCQLQTAREVNVTLTTRLEQTETANKSFEEALDKKKSKIDELETELADEQDRIRFYQRRFQLVKHPYHGVMSKKAQKAHKDRAEEDDGTEEGDWTNDEESTQGGKGVGDAEPLAEKALDERNQKQQPHDGQDGHISRATELASKDAKIKELEGVLRRERDEHASLQNEHEQTLRNAKSSAEMGVKINELEAQLHDERGRCQTRENGYKQKQESHEAALATKDAETKELKHQLQTEQNARETLRQHNEQALLDKDVSTAEALAKRESESKKTLENEQKARKRYEALHDQIAIELHSVNREKKKLEDRVKSLEKQRNDVRSDLKDEKDEKEKLRQKANEKDGKIAQLQADLANMQQEIDEERKARQAPDHAGASPEQQTPALPATTPNGATSGPALAQGSIGTTQASNYWSIPQPNPSALPMVSSRGQQTAVFPVTPVNGGFNGLPVSQRLMAKPKSRLPKVPPAAPSSATAPTPSPAPTPAPVPAPDLPDSSFSLIMRQVERGGT